LEGKHYANRATRRKVKPSTDVASIALGKKWQYACRLYRKNSIKGGEMWRTDPLLGKDLETTGTAVDMQYRNNRPFLSNGSVNTFPRKREAHNNTVTINRRRFLCDPCEGVKKAMIAI
jgi:hypothetical protein